MLMGPDIPEINAQLDAGVLRITLHRPAKKNALTSPMYWRMAELIRAAGASSAVRAIRIGGAPDCFSSGNDVTTFTSLERDADGVPAPVHFLNALAHCELPVVAAVNGVAVGIGTTLLLHCDFVLAGEDALFRTPFVDLGLCPEAASSYTMPLRMGYIRAAQMLLLGETFNAQQALASGLVTAVYPVAEFEQRAGELALRLAALPPTSLRTTKRLLRAPLLAAIEHAMAAENAAFADCMAAPEFGEAIGAFLEKRAPDFSRF